MISGGLEWNILITIVPVLLFRCNGLGRSADGKTVWIGELEMRHRMMGSWLHRRQFNTRMFLRIINRTPLANSMLCFANIAHTNEDYQVIFSEHTSVNRAQ